MLLLLVMLLVADVAGCWLLVLGIGNWDVDKLVLSAQAGEFTTLGLLVPGLRVPLVGEVSVMRWRVLFRLVFLYIFF